MRNLSQKNALLTGASGGLGPYIAQELARHGVNLILAGLPAESEVLAEVARSVGRAGVESLAIPADITGEADRRALLETAQSSMGAVDILINGAGMGEIGQFCDYRQDSVARIVETNLTATLLLTRLVLPGMLSRRQGHIVTLASMAGWVPTPYNSVYAATKAGLIAWTKALRIELARAGVGASVVCPSYVSRAGMHARHQVKAPRIAREVPPERVARAVVRAIQKDIPQVLVTAMPIRPLLALTTLWPAFERCLLSFGGFYDFAERLLAREKMAGSGT